MMDNDAIQNDITKQKYIRPLLDYRLRQFEKKKVAIYARVSRASEIKHRSIEAQKDNLKDEIEKHPNWVFAGCFVDEGITGTKLDRPAFNRMMEDARNGKIDIILTKTVSRFGRNTQAVLKVLQELKELGVTVIFDSERLNTDDPNGLIRLQYLSIMAEQEAKQTSNNMRWSVENYYKRGIPVAMRPYGYKLVNHELVIIPEEAEVIKEIFKMYLDGKGIYAICKELNNRGITTVHQAPWRTYVIHRILRNEVYAGDLLLQKTFVVNCLTKQKKKNDGERPKYLVADNHEAIIDRETFNKVQEEVVRREKIYKGLAFMSDNPVHPEIQLRDETTNDLHKTRANKLFSRLIRCGDCGGSIYYKRISSDGKQRSMWICGNHSNRGPEFCAFKGIREDLLVRTTDAVLRERGMIKNNTELTNELLKKHIRVIIAKPNRELEYHFYNGDIVTKSWRYPSRSKSWTPEMKQKASERSIAMHAKRREKHDE